MKHTKSKSNIVLFLVFFGFNYVFAQNQFLWPLPQGTGKVILKPGNTLNPITNDPIFNGGYFISAPYNTPVFAIDDGVISTTSSFIIISPNLTFMASFTSLESFRKYKKNRAWFKEENLMGMIGIKLKDGSKVHYQGLIAGDTTKKTGHQVKRGEIIGYVGYFKVISEEPCIEISLDKANGTASDIGIPLLGEDNHFDKLIKKEKLAETLDVNSMNEAYDILVISLQEGHPSLYDYTKKETFDTLFENTRKLLNRPMSIQEFRSILMGLITNIGCSHTYLHFVLPVEEKYIFPLWLSWVEGKCIVIGDKSGKNIIPKGTEIKAINGIPINDVIVSLKKVMFNDVQTDEWKETQLIKPNYFEFYLKYALKGKVNQQYKFSIIKPNQEQQEVLVYSLIKTDLPKNQVSPKIITDQEEKISFKRLEKDIAYLSIQTCIMDDTTKEMIGLFIDSLNREGVKNLIIDLRYNLGGSDITNIVKKLVKKPINDTMFQMVKSDTTYSFFKYTLENMQGDVLFSDFKSMPGKVGYWNKSFNDNTSMVNDHPYEGKLYVLTGSGEQSYGAEMAFQLYKAGAIIVGEETGGGFYQMNGISFTNVKLGTTNLVLNIPLMQVKTNFELDSRIPANRGLIPHYKILPTIKSILNDEDNQLDYCIELIKVNND